MSAENTTEVVGVRYVDLFRDFVDRKRCLLQQKTDMLKLQFPEIFRGSFCMKTVPVAEEVPSGEPVFAQQGFHGNLLCEMKMEIGGDPVDFLRNARRDFCIFPALADHLFKKLHGKQIDPVDGSRFQELFRLGIQTETELQFSGECFSLLRKMRKVKADSLTGKRCGELSLQGVQIGKNG